MRSPSSCLGALESIAELLNSGGGRTAAVAAATRRSTAQYPADIHRSSSTILHSYRHHHHGNHGHHGHHGHHGRRQLGPSLQQTRNFRTGPQTRDAGAGAGAGADAAVVESSGGIGVFDTLQGGLEGMHSMLGAAGMPFGGTLIASTVLLRFALTMPPTIYQHQVLARYTRLQPTIKQWSSAIQHKVGRMRCRHQKSVRQQTCERSMLPHREVARGCFVPPFYRDEAIHQCPRADYQSLSSVGRAFVKSLSVRPSPVCRCHPLNSGR